MLVGPFYKSCIQIKNIIERINFTTLSRISFLRLLFMMKLILMFSLFCCQTVSAIHKQKNDNSRIKTHTLQLNVTTEFCPLLLNKTWRWMLLIFRNRYLFYIHKRSCLSFVQTFINYLRGWIISLRVPILERCFADFI